MNATTEMPKLMPLEEYRIKRFSTPPSRQTILKWVHDGDLPAKKIGGRWFIKVNEEIDSLGDERLDRILKAS